MPTRPNLRVLPGGTPSSPLDREKVSADTGMRMSIPQSLCLIGDSLAQNKSLIGELKGHGYSVETHASVTRVLPLLEDDLRSMVLLEATESQQAEMLNLMRALDVCRRRRVVLLVWRPAWNSVRQFIEAGIVDFQRMPVAVPELLLRLELRNRELQRLPIVATGDRRAVLPQTNVLNRSIGPESTAVRLTDREYLLFELLARQLGAVVTRSEILMHVWDRGADAYASSNIADVYVRYLRVKLAKVAPWLTIRTVRGVGYVLEDRDRLGQR
jgi:two-component system, OmpR family, response regulator PrrA